jgi:hypothetical protein
MQARLDNLAHQLRAAVLANHHEKAMGLTLEYAEALSEHWNTLSPSERAGSPLPKLSLELLAWAREMTIMQRALAGEHVRSLDKILRYRTARAFYQESAALSAR